MTTTTTKRPSRAKKDTVEAPAAVDVDQLDRTALYNLAKNERAALKAWEKAGSNGEPPATPAHDRLTDPTKKAKKTSAARKSSKYDDSTTADLIPRITKARASGVSFPKLAEQLNTMSYAHRTDWTGPKLYAFACRHEIGQLTLVKPAKATK